MTLRRKASLAVRKAVRKNLITHEDEARSIARKFLPGEPSYEITLAITDELPKTISKIISKQSYKHPWFQRKVTRIVFEDVWGRVWNQTIGKVKKSIKLVRMPKRYGGGIWVDALGGMMWNSKDGIHFECMFRTSVEEFTRRGPSPETCVGYKTLDIG